MDELEKRIIQKYGTEKIQPEEINTILYEAASAGLIERRDIKPQPAMDASSLIEHISDLRRTFLVNGDFCLSLEDDEAYQTFCCDSEKKESSEILGKVLQAYIEYEKLPEPKKYTKTKVLIVAVLTAVFGFFSYTPKPY